MYGVPPSRAWRPAFGVRLESNERLVAIDGNEVLMRVRADDTGGKRTIAINGVQFIGRAR